MALDAQGGGTRPHRRAARGLGLMVLTSLLLAACNVPGAVTEGGVVKPGGSVTVASWQEQDSLLACNVTAASFHACAYVNPAMEGLLTVKPGPDVPSNPTLADYWQPELSVEVPTLENGDVRVTGNKMDVTWKLRPNVKWHDGAPFTSQDVKSTFDFWWLKYGNHNPTPIVSTSGWDQVESVEIPSETTAIIHFRTVFAPYLTLGTGPYGILPDHLLQQVWAKSGDITREKVTVTIPGAFTGTDTMDRLMVGTGPFMFKEWVSGDHLTMVRNPHWWGRHQPYLQEIRVKFDPDPNTVLSELRANTVELGLDLRAALLPELSRMSQVVPVVILGSSAERLDINLHNAFLQDPVLRQAMLMGIDRQRIVDTLLLGKTSVPPDSWMCIGTGAWCLDPSGKRTSFDPEQARKLLDANGYKQQTAGPCKGFRTDPKGVCVQLHLVTTTLPLREEQQVVIAADLANIGIQIIRDSVTSDRFFGGCTSGGTIYSHNFDLAMYTTGYGAPAEPDTLAFPSYHSSEIPSDSNGCIGANTTYVSDFQLDQALGQARQSVRIADRREHYIEAEQRLASLLPEIPLYQGVDVEAYNKRLSGYKGNEFWWMNNTADWFLTSP